MCVKLRCGGDIAHDGISIQLLGFIEDISVSAGKPHYFISSTLKLSPDSNDTDLVELPFSFGAIGLPYESFEGNRLQIRYALKAILKRTFSDKSVERTIWVKSKESIRKPLLVKPTLMEVGLEEYLQLTISLTNTNHTWKGILRGKMDFQLVKASIVGAELCIIRREEINPGRPVPEATLPHPFPVPTASEVLARHQIIDGPIQRNDKIPFRFHLASCLSENTTPTAIDPHGLFSIRYYLFIELHDKEGRKFYKAHELSIY